MKYTYYKTPSQKLKKNNTNKISFLDFLIETATTTNNNNNLITSAYKKNTYNNSCTLNFKRECSFWYKKSIINNQISRAKLISSSKIIFCKELKNIKQTLINKGFPNYIVDEKNKCTIQNFSQQNKHCKTPSNKQAFI